MRNMSPEPPHLWIKWPANIKNKALGYPKAATLSAGMDNWNGISISYAAINTNMTCHADPMRGI
jgi:hypothetical protein